MMQIINALKLLFKKYLSIVCEFVAQNISVSLAIAHVQIYLLPTPLAFKYPACLSGLKKYIFLFIIKNIKNM